MWVIALFLLFVFIVVLIFIYYSTSNNDSDNNYSESYLPVAPPTLQYMRTLDAPRRNPDLFNATSHNKYNKSEIKEDEKYEL